MCCAVLLCSLQNQHISFVIILKSFNLALKVPCPVTNIVVILRLLRLPKFKIFLAVFGSGLASIFLEWFIPVWFIQNSLAMVWMNALISALIVLIDMPQKGSGPTILIPLGYTLLTIPIKHDRVKWTILNEKLIRKSIFLENYPGQIFFTIFFLLHSLLSAKRIQRSDTQHCCIFAE